MTESPLLRDVLKDEWGFDGLVMSDWGAARSLGRRAAPRWTSRCPGPSGPWGDALVAAVRAGAVREAAVDDKVLRLLRLAARVGALEGGSPPPRRPPHPRPAAPRGLRRVLDDVPAAAGLRAARRPPPRRFVARAQPRLAAAAHRADAAPRRRDRPERGGRAHARRRQRDRLPDLHRVAARRAARGAADAEVDVRARRPRRTRGCPSPTSAPSCASSPPTAACSPPSTARSASSPGSAR